MDWNARTVLQGGSGPAAAAAWPLHAAAAAQRPCNARMRASGARSMRSPGWGGRGSTARGHPSARASPAAWLAAMAAPAAGPHLGSPPNWRVRAASASAVECRAEGPRCRLPALADRRSGVGCADPRHWGPPRTVQAPHCGQQGMGELWKRNAKGSQRSPSRLLHSQAALPRPGRLYCTSQPQPQLWRARGAWQQWQSDRQAQAIAWEAMALRQLAARCAGSGAQCWLRPFSSAAPSVFDKL